MKWSAADVERFKMGTNFTVDSIEGNILIYSHTSKSGTKWQFKARLLRGGKAMSYTVHWIDGNEDLLE